MPSPPLPRATAGIAVPLRSFTLGKARLSTRLDPDARARLGRRMADRVVDAAGERPVAIVSSATEVVEWASARGLHVLDDPGSLDRAAATACEWARRAGLARIVIAHADLPFASSFDALEADGPIAVVVPCHRGDGTTVLSLPASCSFDFAYGPGSFARHCAEARRRHLEVRVVRDPGLSFDVDVPADLDRLGIAPAP